MEQNYGTLLTREEMKNVLGGVDPVENKCDFSCTSATNCDKTCPSCEKGSWGDTKFCVN